MRNVWHRWFYKDIHERIRQFDKKVKKENEYWYLLEFVAFLLEIGVCILYFSDGIKDFDVALNASEIGRRTLKYASMTFVWFQMHFQHYGNVAGEKNLALADILLFQPITGKEVFQARLPEILKQGGIRFIFVLLLQIVISIWKGKVVFAWYGVTCLSILVVLALSIARLKMQANHCNTLG